MRYQICLACMLLVVLAGCSKNALEPSPEEPRELAAPVRQTKPVVATAGAGLEVEVTLSTNTVAVGGNVSITARLINSEETDLAVNRNDLSVWLSVTDSKDVSVTELPFMDRIEAPSKGASLSISVGESEIIRVIAAQVKKGSWKGFGTSGEYKGVGLIVQRDAGASCYPLSAVPGEYSLRCHLRIRSSEAEPEAAIEIVSTAARILIKE
jgi:hypothetical protein